MKSVLVVWVEYVRRFSFVALEVNEDEYERLKSYNKKWINDYDEDDRHKDFFFKNGNFKYDRTDNPIENKKFDLIIITGVT